MDIWSFILNMVVAVILGMVIGLERQWGQHPAGLRTNTLVALGACLFVSMSRLMDDQNSPTRIVSYVVSGLGFLGGGVILHEGLTVKGLTTAATIWCSGAVGSLAGGGFLPHAAIGTAAIMFVNAALRPVALWIDARRRTATDVETVYRVRVACRQDHEALVRTILLRHIGDNSKMSIQSLATEDGEKERAVVVANIYAPQRNDRFMEQIVARLSIEPDVMGVSWEKLPT